MFVKRKRLLEVLPIQAKKKPNIRIEVHLKKGINEATVNKKIRELARELHQLTGEKRIGISMNVF